jgi:lysine 2,3-aminomutase
MMTNDQIFYKPRIFNTIKLWEDITEEEWNDPDWQIRNSIKSVEQLGKVVQINQLQEEEINKTLRALRIKGNEPLRITPYYASLMNRDPFYGVTPSGKISEEKMDPIFWQSVPTPANLMFPNSGSEGVMCENSRSFGAAYQRYPNRVALFVAENTSCASYCVHCQRSKSLDGSFKINAQKIERGLFYLSTNPNIDEVIVTGGDALMIGKKKLQHILEELSKIGHLRVIRIATRVPVVMPMAITDELLDLIDQSANKYSQGEKYVYFMTQINHYQEITQELAIAAKRIRKHGFTIRNQTVLLNHVNNDFETLAETFRRMFWIGIHPYYLLQCHKEKGIVHFIAPIQQGIHLMNQLHGWISGVTMPKYASNIEGGCGKIILMPSGNGVFNNISNTAEIPEYYTNVHTWDGNSIEKYEDLCIVSYDEFSAAMKTMDEFIGRKGVFHPFVKISGLKGQGLEMPDNAISPRIENIQKSSILGYELTDRQLPMTNPAELTNELESLFCKSKVSNR